MSVQWKANISGEDANSILSELIKTSLGGIMCISVFLVYLDSGLFYKPPLLIDSVHNPKPSKQLFSVI